MRPKRGAAFTDIMAPTEAAMKSARHLVRTTNL
jgi:hypothetical protein